MMEYFPFIRLQLENFLCITSAAMKRLSFEDRVRLVDAMKFTTLTQASQPIYPSPPGSLHQLCFHFCFHHPTLAILATLPICALSSLTCP